MAHRDDFMRAFRNTQMNFSQLYARLLTDVDLSLQQFALLNLLHACGTIPMTEASARLNVTKPAVTSIVDRLEKKKWARRSPHPRDRRSFLLQIQPRGREVVMKIQTAVFGNLFKTLDRFQRREKEIVFHFYEELSKTMSKSLKTRRGKRTS